MKRLFDFSLSLLALILASPLMLLIAIKIYIDIGFPVIFKQARPGLNNKIFNMYKFRTMKDMKDQNGNQLTDKERITLLGSFLRKSSLDELPELINIIKGDMSLVGPRPLLKEYLELYSKNQLRRHEMRPGLTGLAQVNGRNAISWEEKFNLDIQYVDNNNFLMDLKIIIMTIQLVIKQDGISAKGEATVSKFKGNKKCNYD